MVGSYLKRGAKNSFFYALASGIVRAISFVFLPYFLQKLTLEEFGIWDFYQSLFSISTLALSSCTAIALTRFVLMFKDDEIKREQAIGNALLGTVLLCVLCLIGSSVLSLLGLLSHTYLFITLSNACFFAFFSLVLAYVRVREYLLSYVLLFCGQNLIAIGLTLLGVRYGFGIESFFYANAFSLAFFSPVFAYLFLRYRAYSFALLKQQLAYSLPLVAYSLIYTGLVTVDRFFIKYNAGYEQLGMYSLLWRFGAISQFVSIAVMDAWPIVLFNAQNEHRSDHLISRLTTYLYAGFATLCIGTIAVSSCAITYVFPIKYHGLLLLLPLFFVFVVLLDVVKIFQTGFGLSARTQYVPVLALIAVAVQAGLLYVSHASSITTVLLSNVASMIFYSGLCYWVGRSVYSSQIFNLKIMRRTTYLFVGFIGGSYYLLAYAMPWYAWAFLLSAWCVGLWAGNIIDEEEKAVVRRFFTRKTSQKNTQPTVLYLRTDICFTEIKAGGSVAHTLGVINGFRELGYTVLCASSGLQSTLRGLELPYFQELQVYPLFAFLRWKLGHLRWRLDCFVANLFFTAQLLIGLRKQQFSFIYQRYSLLNCVGVVLSRIKKVPLVLEYNGSEVWVFDQWGEHLWFKLTRLATWIERINTTAADYIVVVSQPLKDDLIKRGIEGSKILVNPNGVDLELFNAAKLEQQRNDLRKELGIEDKFVFGFIGTFSYWHGIEVLAHIIPQSCKKNSRAHFLLIGDGPLKIYLENEVVRQGVSDQATFTGLVLQKDAQHYLAACDAFLSPTQPNKDGTVFFGSPTKLFEYMSMGKPIIASDLGQIAQILSPSISAQGLREADSLQNKVGILVAPEDVQGFIKAIEALLDADERKIKELGAGARAKVEHAHSWYKHVENIVVFYRQRRNGVESRS